MSSSCTDSYTQSLQTMQADNSAACYGTDFERSLMSSTPKKSPHPTLSPQSSIRTRKTASILDADHSTFHKCISEAEPKEPETEWEKWILKKAKELSFSQEQKIEAKKKEKLKRKEEKRAKQEKLMQQEIVIEDWKQKKLELYRKKVSAEKARLEEIRKKEEVERNEVLEKSTIAVDVWNKQKNEKLKELKAKKSAEEKKKFQLKEERREKAKVKYEQWLKDHKNENILSQSKALHKTKTLPELYSPVEVKLNPEPWNSETEIRYDKVKVLYTPFL